MPAAATIVRHALRSCLGAMGSCALWLVWLLLAGAAAAQLYVANREELAVPEFLLRRVEARMAEAGIRASFARATFDPTGRLLAREPKLFLEGMQDPVVVARAAYVRLDPWAILIGQFEPREVELISGEILVPAMLSPSGRHDSLARDIDAALLIGRRELVIRRASAKLGSLPITLRGSLPIGDEHATGSPEGVGAWLQARFKTLARGSVLLTRQLEQFDAPALDLELERSPGRGLVIVADIQARAAQLTQPITFQARNLRARARIPLLGSASALVDVDLAAETISVADHVTAAGVRARFRGRTAPERLGVDPMELDFALGEAKGAFGVAQSASGSARVGGPGEWNVRLTARAYDSDVAAAGAVNLSEQTARISASGQISPRILQPISARAGRDVSRYFSFAAAECQRADVILGPAWKFQGATIWARLRGIDAHGVRMEEGAAMLYVDQQGLRASEAYARIGPNFARGSYTHDFGSNAFRFLLNGRLRPLAISGWFQSWWEHFFQRMDFPAAPPVASVDVRGRWRHGRETTVFVFADAPAPVVHGEALDRVRTRLFIRPGFYDGLELWGARGPGEARGIFTVVVNMNSGKWRSIEAAGRSSLPFDTVRGIVGPVGHALLEPFEVAAPPLIQGRGRFDGPDVAGPRRRELELEGRTAGGFSLHAVPLEDVAFKAVMRGDDVTIDTLGGAFAGGQVKVHAKISGTSPRRLGFDASLTGGSLGAAVGALQQASAAWKGRPPPAPGKFVQEKANVKLDLDLSADGVYGDLLSFTGGGNALLNGEVGEVPLFGPLSEMLKFTALRFTSARGAFKVNGPEVNFSEVELRGANSAIDAHGTYALDRRELDFRAKVFPFQESGSMLKTVVGAMLTPLSNVLEVKLTGTFEKPSWAFVIGPTNLIRSLGGGEPEKGTAATAESAKKDTASEPK